MANLAKASAGKVLLIVVRTNTPPGRSNCAIAVKNTALSATCSITSDA